MYTINELAEKLGVETVKVHEMLVLERIALKDYVKRIDGVLKIDETGYKLLSNTFFDKSDEQSKISIDNNSKSADNISETVKVEDDVIDKKSDEIDNEDVNDEDLQVNASIHDDEMLKFKETHSKLKQEIGKLDIQIKREEDALAHYQKLLETKMTEYKNAEVKFLKKILHQ